MTAAANKAGSGAGRYSSADIEVLEGLEPVRRRPRQQDRRRTGGRKHAHCQRQWARHPGRAASEVQRQERARGHSDDLALGGKFSGDAYTTSGGLHGVGSSVVNALSEFLEVEVARDRQLWTQRYVRGKPVTGVVNGGTISNRRGTTVRFKPDPQIFGSARFTPSRLFSLCRSKAYLFRGVQIRWKCD